MSWRLALRLARREVLRRPGRTVLVVLLVAVPVGGMTLAAVLFRTEHLTPAERFDQYNGDDVDAVTYPGGAGGELPEGSETHDVRTIPVIVEGAESSINWDLATDAPLDGPFQGRYGLVEGQAPAGAGEVALSRRSASDAGVGIGDEITLRAQGDAPEDDVANPAPPGEPQQVTVVSFVEDRDCLDCPGVSIHPDQPLPGGYGPSVERLARLPADVSEEELAALADAHGWLDPETWPQQVNDDSGQSAKVMWSWVVGAVALTATGIVISAAFAVGARRQLTTLGQLSATGASPHLLRRTLSLQGTVTGVVGVALAWSLTATILVLGRGRLEQLMKKRLPAWELQPLDLAVVAIIGLVAATVAALIPARTAVRVPTLTALAGRRPLSPVPRWLTLTGLATIAAGLGLLGLAVLGATNSDNDTGGSTEVWALVAIVGGVLQLLGACAVTPALTGRLEPLAGRLRGPWRLAARSLARHRTRTGAVVAAVAVAAALAVFAGAMVRGLEERDRDEDASYHLPEDLTVAFVGANGGAVYPADEGRPSFTTPDAEIVEDLEAVIPDAESATLRTAVQQPGGSARWTMNPADAAVAQGGDPMAAESAPWTVEPPLIADDTLLEMFDVPGDLRQLVESEGLLWAEHLPPGQQPESVMITTPAGTELEATVASANDLPTEWFGGLFISPELARSLDLTEVDTAVALRSPDPLTGQQEDELWALQTQDSVEGGMFDIWLQTDDDGITPVQIEMLLAGAALVITLFVIATSLALAAAESRDEREVLTVVGTRPRDLARSAGAKAALLAGLGTVLALPLGLAPVVVISWSWSRGVPIRPPWPSMGLLVAVVPLLVALAATVASAVAQRTRPIRISTATFE